MKDDWTKVSYADFMADVNRAKSETYGGTHAFVLRKRLKWPFCSKCGLVQLRNSATEKAIKRGCVS